VVLERDGEDSWTDLVKKKNRYIEPSRKGISYIQ